MNYLVLFFIFGLISPYFLIANAQKFDDPPTMDIFDENKVLLKTIADKLIENEHQKFQNSILVSASTIFAFVSFGSLLALRFEGGSLRRFILLVRYTMLCLFAIAASQIYIIISIISETFNELIYIGMLFLVITAFGLILFFIYQIISERSREPTVEKEKDYAFEYMINDLKSAS